MELEQNVATEAPKTEEATNDFSKIAEVLNRQSNPLEDSKPQSFVAEPFFKEPEVEKAEEAKAAEDTTASDLNEDGLLKTPAEITQESNISDTPIKEDQILAGLNSVINDPDLSFNSIDDIKAIITENKKFKEAEGQLQGLSQEERARIEVGREFGDSSLFDRVTGIDTSKISHKDALKQVYFFDNVGKNIQYLEKTFEREFSKRYDEEPDEEYSKMDLENNGQEAISKLIELQEDFKKRGKISGSADPEAAKKAKIEEDNKWFAAVDNVLGKSDRVTYTLEDGLAINIVMDAKDKAVIQNYMDRPIDFLRSQITDEKGNYDHEALLEFILRNVYYEKALNEANKSGAAIREEKILKDKKNIVIKAPEAGDTGTQTSLPEQFVNSFRARINS